MKLIVGLGNPGPQYEKTRHNAGFLALDRFAGRHARGAGVRQRFGGEATEFGVGQEKVILLKPMRFMNCSGAAVAEAAGFYQVQIASDLLVVVDDYALPLGALRIRAEGSSGGHNGLSDVERALGTTAYPRLRIGVDAPPQGWNDPADWVLSRFTDEQFKALDPALDRAADAVGVFISRGLTPAMNQFNVKPKESSVLGAQSSVLKPGTVAPKPAPDKQPL